MHYHIKIKKFTAVYSAPFLKNPLISEIGQEASTVNAKKILMGIYNKKKYSLRIQRNLSDV